MFSCAYPLGSRTKQHHHVANETNNSITAETHHAAQTPRRQIANHQSVLRLSDHSAQHKWPQHHPPRPRAACSAAAATSQHPDQAGRSFATHRPTPLVRYGGQPPAKWWPNHLPCALPGLLPSNGLLGLLPFGLNTVLPGLNLSSPVGGEVTLPGGDVTLLGEVYAPAGMSTCRDPRTDRRTPGDCCCNCC